MAVSEIRALLEKRGLDLRQTDVEELRALLTQVPDAEHDEVAFWVWEAVAQVVIDPAYTGDAQVPELEGA